MQEKHPGLARLYRRPVFQKKYEASIALIAELGASSHADGDAEADDLDGLDSDGEDAMSSDEEASLDFDQVRRFAHATHIPCVVCCCRLCNVWCLVCARVSLWFCAGASSLVVWEDVLVYGLVGLWEVCVCVGVCVGAWARLWVRGWCQCEEGQGW